MLSPAYTWRKSQNVMRQGMSRGDRKNAWVPSKNLNTNSEWSRAKSAPAERQLVNRLFLLCPQINLFMACKIEARLTNIGDPIVKRPKFWKPPPYDLLIENSACSLSFPVDRDESLCRWFAKNRQINRATIQLHTSTWRHDKNSL